MIEQWHCPGCGKKHRPLKDLLTCCPVVLRVYTDLMVEHDSGEAFRALLGGHVPPRLRRLAKERMREE